MAIMKNVYIEYLIMHGLKFFYVFQLKQQSLMHTEKKHITLYVQNIMNYSRNHHTPTSLNMMQIIHTPAHSYSIECQQFKQFF